MIDENTVRHVAKLARIELRDSEVSLFSGQLKTVLDYMRILEELDTETVSPCHSVTGLCNVFEEDEIVSSQSTREELLDCSELPKDSSQIRVMNVFE